MCLLRLENFIPDSYQKNLYNVDYSKLYEDGYKLILMDLDNTLLGYQEEMISDEKKELVDSIKEIGFKVVLISNNHKKRVRNSALVLGVEYVNSMRKPFKHKMKKAIFKTGFKLEETICIGDQLTTDVQAGKRLKIYTILVDSIDRKKEILITKFNRMIEKRALMKLKKKYPDKYEILRDYDRRNYNE